MKIDKLLQLLKKPKEIPVKINYRYPNLLRWMNDEQNVKFWYRYCLKKNLNLQQPKTFNEKLQWLKLNDRNPKYIKMVDKYEAKKYVAERIGEQYVIPTIGVWEKFEDIDFEALPHQFVLKCTHDSGGVVVCKDKSQLDIRATKKKINRSLKRNFYLVGREWPYKNVKPRIIAEQYLEDKETTELQDYKFMCFGGKVQLSFVCSGRSTSEGLQVTFFDKDWNVMPFERHYPSLQEGVPCPANYKEMVALSEALSADIPFIRVDFYDVSGKIYFGELTFYPGSGYEEFTPEEWDERIGRMLKLPVSG